jgi:hypothetical protein
MSARSPRSRTGDAVEAATRRAMMARDAGLRRISAVTRWTAAAVVALSGALALIAAKAFHGHPQSTAGSTSVGTAPTPPAIGSQVAPPTPLQQPEQPPVAQQQAPAVVSGGS